MRKDAALPQSATTRTAVNALEAERAAARYGSIHERWSRLRPDGTAASGGHGASGVSISPIVGIVDVDPPVPLPIRTNAAPSLGAVAAESLGVTSRPASEAGSEDTGELVALSALKPKAHYRWALCGVLAVVASILYFLTGPEPGNEHPGENAQVRGTTTHAETLRPAPLAPFDPVVEAPSAVGSSPAQATEAAPLPIPEPLPSKVPETQPLREAARSAAPRVASPLMTKDPQRTKLHGSRQKPPPKEGQDGIIGRVPF